MTAKLLFDDSHFQYPSPKWAYLKKKKKKKKKKKSGGLSYCLIPI